MVIIASVLTAGVASGWAAGLLVAARAAKAGAVIAAVVDAAILTKQYFIEGFGVIDQNKYGCSFPITGFNHTYGFNVSFEEAIQDSSSLLSNLTDDPELQNEYMNQLYDNFIGYSVAGAATVGILLWILFS